MPENVTTAELFRVLTRVEGKLDQLASDHEARIRALERNMWIAMGGAGAGVASGLGAWIQVLLQ